MTQSPPLLLATLALFWGWQTGLWVPAIVLAGGLEWVIRTPLRWRLAEKEIERIVDLTSLAIIALIFFEYTDGTLAEGLFTALCWAPLLLAPLVSAQVLSAREGLARRALFLSQRRSRSPEADATVDLIPPYLGACLLAGSAAPGGDAAVSFAGLAVLSGWLLWFFPRPRARRLVTWAGLLALALGLAYLGQIGLRQGQSALEEATVRWLAGLFQGDTDPYRARTAIGEIGQLKLSDRILFRVEVSQALEGPLLLRTASYDRFVNTSWLTHERRFTPIDPTASGWRLGEPTGGSPSWARISTYLDRQGMILPLPLGAWRIEDLPVGELSRHPLGAIKAEDGPPLVRYRVVFGPAASADASPREADLRVPKNEQAALRELVERLELTAERPEQTMQAIRQYFRRAFRYTLELPGAHPGRTPIEYFLRERRRGHCELFASASVLLLRQAGLPARYAVGYSVQEPGRGADRYLVRRSHAHAWTLVWHHGRWWSLDTTPALWYAYERDQRPFWQPLADSLSGLAYRFHLSRLDPSTASRNPWLWGSLLVLFAILAYRLRLGRAFRRAAEPASEQGGQAETDLPLAGIAATLHQAGFPRKRSETYRQWLARLGQEPDLARPMRELDEILVLYERHRYRPGGLNTLERARLQALISTWEADWLPAVMAQAESRSTGGGIGRGRRGNRPILRRFMG